MEHPRKWARVRALTHLSRYPRTYQAILDAIESKPALADALTARGLADLVDLLHSHWRNAQAAAEREACGEGAIWDDRTQRLREIAA